MKSIILQDFQYGTIDSVEEQSIPDTAASASLNWITEGTKIALRRGYHRLGLTENTGTGSITGLIVAKKIGLSDTTEIPFRKRGRKLEYYDATTDDWIETGTDVFPTTAEDEHVTFSPYMSITGSQLWVNSPNGAFLKIMVANPGSYSDMSHTTNFKGYIAIKQNRMFLWDRGGTTKDRTGLYGSWLDKDEATDHTSVSAEAIGSSGSTNYTGTLAFKAGGSRRTCFEVTFTDGTETFTDNLDGTLTGSAGGTGTINYTTGAYNITFASTTLGAVTATYKWEDSADSDAGTSNTGGIADFSKSSPRTAGEGFIFRQDDGGGVLRSVLAIKDVEYCMHDTKTWALTLSTTDTEATNLLYRDRVGIPNLRAAVETGDGVYYIDDTDQNDPHFRLLSFDPGGSEVVPSSISKRLKLNNERVGKSLAGYSFDQAAMIEWGDLILVACRTSDSTVNNRIFTYNKQTGAIDEHDYYVNCFAIYNGTLIAGDSLTGNVYTLFSGLDDDESDVANYWEGSLNDFDTTRLKLEKRLVVQGEIGPDQSITVSIAIDRGNFVEVGTIDGSGDYVDRTNRITIGSLVLGSGEIGGGGDGIEAYNYMREFTLRFDKFRQIKVRFEATAIGYASVSTIEHKDIREKWARIPAKYR